MMSIPDRRAGLRVVGAAGCSVVALAMSAAWPATALAAWNYADVLSRLNAGELPHVVMHLEDCVAAPGKPGPKVTAVTRFETYNLTEKWIATSRQHLFMSADGSMSLQYVRLRLLPGNTAMIYSQRLDPVTFKPLIREATELTCKGEGDALTFVAPESVAFGGARPVGTTGNP